MGVRNIEVDVCDGAYFEGKLIPYVSISSSMAWLQNYLRLDEVLQTINENAFVTSKFPIVINLDVKCNIKNQTATAFLLKKTLGESLLLEKENPGENEMPSPNALKEKVIVRGSCEDELVEEQYEAFYLGKIWVREGKVFHQKELIWQLNTISFEAPTSDVLIEMLTEPYFVGKVSQNIQSLQIKTFKDLNGTFKEGNFFVSTKNKTEEFVLTIYNPCNPRGSKEHGTQVPLVWSEKKFFLNTDRDRVKKFDSMSKLIEYYQENQIGSSRIKLCEPICLRSCKIHKYTDWFRDVLDEESIEDAVKAFDRKGEFFVQKEKPESNYSFTLQYFDGKKPKQMRITEDSEGKFSLPCSHGNQVESIVQFVNHFKLCFVENATRLGEPSELDRADIQGKKRINLLNLKIEKQELDTLNPKLLSFSHKTSIVLSGSCESEIEFTKKDHLDILFDALQTQIKKEGRQQTDFDLTIPQKVQCQNLRDLFVYCKSKRRGITNERVKETNRHTMLRKTGERGLLTMLDKANFIDYQHSTSTEKNILTGIVTPCNINDLIEFHQTALSKVYLSSVWCENFNPLLAWKTGAQMACLNLQTPGNDLRINRAMFDSNGNCGYVLKPEALNTGPDTACIVNMRILEGRQLQTVKNPLEELFNPHIKVLLHLIVPRGHFNPPLCN